MGGDATTVGPDDLASKYRPITIKQAITAIERPTPIIQFFGTGLFCCVSSSCFAFVWLIALSINVLAGFDVTRDSRTLFFVSKRQPQGVRRRRSDRRARQRLFL